MKVFETIKAILRPRTKRQGDTAERCRELELRCRALEKRLENCFKLREPMKLRRMARMLRFGRRANRFTPAFAAEQLGMKPYMVQDYLAELLEAGMVERIRRGYYKVTASFEGGDPETEIARGLARRRERGGREDGS
jgi:hypothetical protein